MTKIDIFSGFLGAGKTTLIKKLIAEAYAGEKLVLVENEFGEVGVDGAFLQDAGIAVTEMNSGCICCSLAGDFSQALGMVLERYHPDRILIEPSGVGKLSDVVQAVEKVPVEGLVVNALTTVADAKKCRVYLKNFGEFYRNQLQSAHCIVLSRTAGLPQAKLDQALELIRDCNPDAAIITTPWDDLTGTQILQAMEQTDTLATALDRLKAEHQAEVCPVCGHHHEHEHSHEHEHDHEHSHEHEHEHDHDHEHAHEHEHHNHHDHDADEVFQSWGVETAKCFSRDALTAALTALDDDEVYGVVLRAKGVVAGEDGTWLQFDYVPGEYGLREGPAAVTGRLCVIGSGLKEAAVAALFGM